MSGQLVRPGEPPATASPATNIGLLSSVSPDVSLVNTGIRDS